jgi:hypothetical protein
MNGSQDVDKVTKLPEQEYHKRNEVSRLRRELYERELYEQTPANLEALVQALQEEEKELAALRQRVADEADDQESGIVVDTRTTPKHLGVETTGLEVQVYLRVAQLPTAIGHLLNQDHHPLVTCKVRNARKEVTRRLRITSFIEGFSTRAIDTVELKAYKEHEFDQLPVLLPERVQTLNEMTRATLNIMLEDLDGRVELHKTAPIWLLAKTTAPLAVRDPKTEQWLDLTPYFGAFVTPNAPSITEFRGTVARYHSNERLVGYQQADPTLGVEEKAAIVRTQVKAVFDALKAEANVRYIHSYIAFSPEEGTATQRVRLPSESLEQGQANCIDGTVLFASLLEAISLSPAIVVVPGHAFVAWETWLGSDEWQYLETTMIHSHDFEVACATAEATATRYEVQANGTGNQVNFRRWPLRVLRSERGITPME